MSTSLYSKKHYDALAEFLGEEFSKPCGSPTADEIAHVVRKQLLTHLVAVLKRDNPSFRPNFFTDEVWNVARRLSTPYLDKNYGRTTRDLIESEMVEAYNRSD